MLFRKDQPHCCSCCAHSTKLNEDQMLCTKRGPVSTQHSCRKFTYDPLKRIPVKKKAPDFSSYDEEDFSL